MRSPLYGMLSKHNTKIEMSKYFELIIEIIGWLQIFLSPFLLGIIIGAFAYFPNQTDINLIIALLISFVGFIGGTILATKKFRRKEGTIRFLSRTMASSELDKKKETESSK